MWPQEDTLVRIKRHDDDWMGIALATAVGLGAGLVTGLVASELIGSLDRDRMRRALGRLQRSPREKLGTDPTEVEGAIGRALGRDPITRALPIGVRALGEGIVELTGTAPTPEARTLAGQIARGVRGADVVVNRILIEGWDLPTRTSTPTTAG